MSLTTWREFLRATDHPKFKNVCDIVQKLGYEIKLIRTGDSHVEVIKTKDGIIKNLCLREDARWLDFEHEVGHIKQRLRFKDEEKEDHDVLYPTEIKTGSQEGVLNKTMDTILELHNRLHEFNRLFYRKAPLSVLKNTQPC